MRRALSLALVLTLAAGIFTGCGGSASSQGGQAAATPEPTATPEPYEANALTGEETAELRSTKADSAHHGFGLPGMREIAGRYGGSLEAGPREGRFELLACLPVTAGQ